MGYINDSWADDQTRYGNRHRWRRRDLIRRLLTSAAPGNARCPHCDELLLKPFVTFTQHDGYSTYTFTPPPNLNAWLSKNLHLDHTDDSNSSYHGLVHAACNLRRKRTS